MGIATSVFIYLTIWWTTLFTILPLGTRTHAEMGIDLKDGGDPGAPVNPNLKRKFFTTTWVSILIYGAFRLVVHFHLVPLPGLPSAS